MQNAWNILSMERTSRDTEPAVVYLPYHPNTLDGKPGFNPHSLHADSHIAKANIMMVIPVKLLVSQIIDLGTYLNVTIMVISAAELS